MTAHELTDADRELVRWFAEERLEMQRDEDFGGWGKEVLIEDQSQPYKTGYLCVEMEELLGWPGFGLAAAEARKAGLIVMLYHGLKGAQDWLVWIERDPAHEHADPALAAYAALRDALGVRA